MSMFFLDIAAQIAETYEDEDYLRACDLYNKLMKQGEDDFVLAAAYLSQALEYDYTEQELKEKGIPSEVIAAVFILTKGRQKTYAGYLGAIRNNAIARTVKLAELVLKLDNATPKQMKKYTMGILTLLGHVPVFSNKSQNK